MNKTYLPAANNLLQPSTLFMQRQYPGDCKITMNKSYANHTASFWQNTIIFAERSKQVRNQWNYIARWKHRYGFTLVMAWHHHAITRTNVDLWEIFCDMLFQMRFFIAKHVCWSLFLHIIFSQHVSQFGAILVCPWALPKAVLFFSWSRSGCHHLSAAPLKVAK